MTEMEKNIQGLTKVLVIGLMANLIIIPIIQYVLYPLTQANLFMGYSYPLTLYLVYSILTIMAGGISYSLIWGFELKYEYIDWAIFSGVIRWILILLLTFLPSLSYYIASGYLLNILILLVLELPVMILGFVIPVLIMEMFKNDN